MRRSRRPRDQAPASTDSEFQEEVIFINRVAKVVKGGRKFHFTALVALGDRTNRVGLGYGKAGEVVDAIKKGIDDAKVKMITVVKEGTTIPYEIKSRYCASTILLRPAAKGHGIIAGGVARPILALAGYEDVTAKFVGSTTAINCARATFQALKMIASKDYITRLRNGEKMDGSGRFLADVRRDEAKQAIEAFTAEEQAEAAGPSVQEVREAAPAKAAKADAAPAETAVEAAAAETMKEEPAGKAEDVAPAEAAKMDDAPAADAGEDAPAEAIEEEAPVEEAGEGAPAGKAEEDAPAETAGDDAPAEAAEEVAPTETEEEDKTAKNAKADAPVEEASEGAPANSGDESSNEGDRAEE